MTDKDMEQAEKAIEAEVLENDENNIQEDTEDSLTKSLEKAQQEIQAEKDRYLRLYAEFDNYKKRSARDMQDFRKFANESIIKEILPVVDNLERAILSSEKTDEASKCIIEGVDMTLKEIFKVLEKFHVQPIESIGNAFDPNYHQAMGQEESEEYGENIVVREFQKGYLLHERLIRPSMVMVSKPKPAPEPENASEAEDEQEV